MLPLGSPDRDGTAVALPATATRQRLAESAVALVEDVCSPGADRVPREDVSPRFQVCLPYRGAFVWRVEGDDVFGDPNQVLFVSGGESFRLLQAVPTRYAELIVTPAASVLRDLTGTDEPWRWRRHDPFRRRRRRMEPSLQIAAARLRRLAARNDVDPVAVDEAIVALLTEALRTAPTPGPVPLATRRLVDRTKAFLHARGARPLGLADIARAVDASPAHLTSVFRRVEGVPLHRYLVQLRLAHALVELPHVESLAALALALGFSSHSHFTAAFRSVYRCMPSAYRDRPALTSPR